MEVTQETYVIATVVASLGLSALVATLVWLAVRGCDDSNWIDDNED